jgi:hypothetical protein
MFSRFLSAAFVAALCATGMASAQQATPVPDVKPDFSSFQFMLGTWNCKTLKNDMGRGAGRTETDVYSMSLDGHYIKNKSTSKAFDAARTRTLDSEGWMSWDKAKKHWYSFGISNFGGFGMSTTPGWVGNKIVWTDVYATDGGTLGVTYTTKVSATKITDVNVTGGHKTSDVCIKAS